MAIHLKNFALASIATAALVACGGGENAPNSSGGESGSTAALSTYGGQLVKGPIFGARIQAQQLVNGTWQNIDGATDITSLTDGSYQLKIDRSISPIRLVATNPGSAEMLDETTQKKVPMGNLQLTSVINNFNQSETINAGINLLTDAAAKIVGNNANPDLINSANQAVAALFNIKSLDIHSLETNFLKEGDTPSDNLSIINKALLETIGSIDDTCDSACVTAKVQDSLAIATSSLLDKDTLQINNEAFKDNALVAAVNSKLSPEKQIILDEKIITWSGEPGSIGIPSKTDLRYAAKFGEILNADKVENPNKDYFLFRIPFSINGSTNWATSQFYKAKHQGTGETASIIFKDFSFGAENSLNPEVKFDSANVAIGCANPLAFAGQGTSDGQGSSSAVVTIASTAKVVTDVTKLHGKIFAEYTCGTDYDHWNAGVKKLSDVVTYVKFASDGKISLRKLQTTKTTTPQGDVYKKAGFADKDMPSLYAKDFAGPNGYKESNVYQSHSTIYELNGNYYILQKDEDFDDDPKAGTRATAHGLNLLVQVDSMPEADYVPPSQGGDDSGNGGSDSGNGGSDSGNGGSDSGNGGSDSGNPNNNNIGGDANVFYLTESRGILDRSQEIKEPHETLSSQKLNFIYFKKDKTISKVFGYKYINESNPSLKWGYDFGEFIYLNDINKFENINGSEYKGKKFSDSLIMGCMGDSWNDNFILAVADTIPMINSSKELGGKTFTQYSCDNSEINGYSSLSFSADGSTISIPNDNGSSSLLPSSAFFSNNGFKSTEGSGQTYFYKAFSVNGTQFLLGVEENNQGFQIAVENKK